MTDASNLRITVLLSVQRALLGEITPRMRAISVEWSPLHILVHVYHDGPPAPSVVEEFHASAITQILADFPYPDQGDPRVDLQFHDNPAPTPIAFVGDLVFARAGEQFAAA